MKHTPETVNIAELPDEQQTLVRAYLQASSERLRAVLVRERAAPQDIERRTAQYERDWVYREELEHPFFQAFVVTHAECSDNALVDIINKYMRQDAELVRHGHQPQQTHCFLDSIVAWAPNDIERWAERYGSLIREGAIDANKLKHIEDNATCFNGPVPRTGYEPPVRAPPKKWDYRGLPPLT